MTWPSTGAGLVKSLLDSGWTMQDLFTLYYGRARKLGYVSTSFFTLLAYDWLSNIPDEVQLIWLKKWTASTYMYIFLRVFPLAMQSFETGFSISKVKSLKSCRNFWWTYTSIGILIQIFAIQLLLQGRVYALYGCSWKILVVNGILWLGSAAAVAYTLSQELPRILVFLVPKPIKGCWGAVPSKMYEPFVPAAAYETYLWCIVAYKAYTHLSAYRKARLSALRSEALLAILVRDSFLWFSAAALLMIGNIISIKLAKDGYNFLCLPITQFATSAGGCRLILNVRRAYFAEHDSTEQTHLETFLAAPITGVSSAYPAATTFAIATREMETTQTGDEKEDPIYIGEMIGDEFSQDVSKDPEALFGMHMAAVERMRKEAHQRRTDGDTEMGMRTARDEPTRLRNAGASVVITSPVPALPTLEGRQQLQLARSVPVTVAQRLTKLLTSANPPYDVTSIIRSESQSESIRSISPARVTPLVLSLENSPTSDFTRVFEGANLVYFSAGAGGKPGENGEAAAERTRKVDYEGALKVFDAIEGVSAAEKPRLILVSAIDVRERDQIPGHYDAKDIELSERMYKVMPVYLDMKLAADKDLIKRTAFKWTILRPGGLRDEPGTGRVDLGRTHLTTPIPRDDVATILYELASRPEASGLAIDVIGGDKDIVPQLDAFIEEGVSDFLL
ncbi:hypothetical protein FRB99_003048 [Tulasnella sp. 403]|nr:hypothetical protein FRB99_003048 [Tulasnella sp. 403]